MAQRAFAEAAGHHGDVVDVGVLHHRGQRGFGVARGEFMPGVFFPQLREVEGGILLFAFLGGFRGEAVAVRTRKRACALGTLACLGYCLMKAR